MLKSAFNECPSECSEESQHLFSKRCRVLSPHSARHTGFFPSLPSRGEVPGQYRNQVRRELGLEFSGPDALASDRQCL